MLKTASDKGMSSIFMVHRRELIKQSTNTFNKVGVKHGIIAAGWYEDPRHLVQIASVQTLARRVKWLKKPSLIIWDECHHVAAGGWAKIHEQFPDAFHIGLTATPERLDGTGLGKWFKAMVNGPSVEWLIEQGDLANYKLYAPSNLNLTKVGTQMGDYNRKELGGIVDKPTITGDAIKHYIKYAFGKRAVVFCVSVDHSKHVTEQFRQAGISAAHVDGETPTEERDETIRKFEEGTIKVVSNVELFGEGFDLPALEVAILLRPTKSLGLYLQQVGRALRPSPGKTHAIILDHAGNCERHGLPDEARDWSLEGSRKRKKEDSTVHIKICPSCFAANASWRKECSCCKYIFAVVGREVEFVDGQLEEVQADEMRRFRLTEQGKCETKEDLLALAKKRGYRNPHGWVHVIMQHRQRRKLEGQPI